MPRQLRIAVSVFFGLLTAALCVLWVRSHVKRDAVLGRVTATRRLDISSFEGHFNLRIGNRPAPPREWKWFSHTIEEWHEALGRTAGWGPLMPTPYFVSLRTSPRFDFWTPYWFPVLAFASIAVAPWLPIRRFSLRTLLIATTLLAVVLGLGVWLIR